MRLVLQRFCLYIFIGVSEEMRLRIVQNQIVVSDSTSEHKADQKRIRNSLQRDFTHDLTLLLVVIQMCSTLLTAKTRF